MLWYFGHLVNSDNDGKKKTGDLYKQERVTLQLGDGGEKAVFISTSNVQPRKTGENNNTGEVWWEKKSIYIFTSNIALG